MRYLLIGATLLVAGCDEGEEVDALDLALAFDAVYGESAAEWLNERMIVEGESYVLRRVDVDPTLDVAWVGDTLTVVEPGDRVVSTVDFTAGGADVSAIGVRSGDAGDIHVVEQPGVVGLGAGRLSVAFEVPAGTCAHIDDGCTTVPLQLFVVGSDEAVSAPAVGSVVLVCGDCLDDSCRALLDCA